MIKTILLKEFKRDKWILYFSFAIILGINLFFRMYEYSDSLLKSNHYYYNGMNYTQYSFIYVLTGFVAVIISMILFSYLHNKEKIDLQHRLPLNRKQTYIIKYIKGVLYFAIPFFATVILMFLLDRFVFFQEQLLSWYFVLSILKGFMVITLVYTIFVVANLLCGMSIYALLCGTFFLSFPFIMYAILDDLMKTYPQTKVSIESVIYDNLFDNGSNHLGDYVLIIICLAIIIALLNIFGLKLYKARKSESVSTPIAIEKAKTPLKVIVIYGAFYTFYFAELAEKFFFQAVIIIVLALVCELLVNQGMRNLKFKNIGKNIGIVVLLNILTYVYVDTGIYENTFVNKSSRDVVLMEVMYNSSMLDDDYVNTKNENLDTTIYISNLEAIENIFPVLYELEENCVDDVNRHNIYIKTYKPAGLSSNYYGESYNYTINVHNEYEKELFEFLLSNAPEENRYKTAYSLIDSGLKLYLGHNEYSSKLDVSGYNLQENSYPKSIALVYTNIKTALEIDLAYLSTKDVSTFDYIPITIGSYYSEGSRNLVTFPITSEAKNLIDVTKIKEQPFVIYDNLSLATFIRLMNNEDVIENSIASVKGEDKWVFDYDTQIENYSSDWNDIYYYVSDYAIDPVYTSTIERKDVALGNVEILVYTGEINIDVIDKYNLQLITDTLTNKIYFGYIAE